MVQQRHANLRDVGLTLRGLRAGASSSSKQLPAPTELPLLPCGRLLRCGTIDHCTWEELRRPGTVINLRACEEDAVDPSLHEHGVKFIHAPAENRLEKYETRDPEVQAWLLEVLRTFEAEDTQYPVLIHCRFGRDRTGIVVAALLSLLGISEALIVKEFMLSEEAPEDLIKQALSGFRKAGGAEAYFGQPKSGDGLDVELVKSKLMGTWSLESEVQWLQQEVQILLRLGQQATKALEDAEAAYRWGEAALGAAELARLLAPAEAAAALCYRGMALGQLQRYREAREAVSLALSLADRGGAKPQVLKALQSEQKKLSAFDDTDFEILEASKAAEIPGNPYVGTMLLEIDENVVPKRWQVHRCPEGFSWLRCGELAASAAPGAAHLPALESLGLSKRVSAQALGAPKPREVHVQEVITEAARAVSSGSGCLLFCSDGFASCSVALACFMITYGLDEPVKADNPGQPKMTAGEAIEVLRSLRPGSLAEPGDEEFIQDFDKDAWAKHIEKAQRAFSGRAAATSSSAPRKQAPSSARVVRQPGDGNCLFHSLAYGLGGQATATNLRLDICSFMEKNPSLSIAGTSLAEWIQMLAGSSVQQYAKKMAKSAQWGGAPEIAACAHMRQVNVHVYERKGTAFELTVPFDVGSSKTVSVLYVGGVHYDALVF